MQFSNQTLPTPEANLALDEELIQQAEVAGPQEFLRLWEPATPFVVVGRNSQIEAEVDLARCEADGVPVLRRTSGGLAIVTGPGCLMYAVVLSYQWRPHLRALDQAHRFVLDALLAALSPLVDGLSRQGTCDLVWQGRKFSGNSLRCKREHLLYHGTLLYDMNLELISRYLKFPHRVPDYREGRSHADFVTNIPVRVEALRAAVQSGFTMALSRS